MEEILLQIAALLREGRQVDDAVVTKLVHASSRGAAQPPAKRQLLPFYLRTKQEDPERWASWQITPDLERELLRVIRIKPRRTASGVATITVITKPWPCSGDCVFCPSDLRMPKSYLHDEPACARAEQNRFDPYLQVSSRLTALSQMGHATDKIELIVLGGTWTDYPEGYQVWFMSELFRALNDDAVADEAANPMLRRSAAGRGGAEAAMDAVPDGCLPKGVAERRARYRECFLAKDAEALAQRRAELQAVVDAGHGGGRGRYNAAVKELYGAGSAWGRAMSWQSGSWEELERQQRANERARHRVVGLVIETRPDAVTARSLRTIRRLGCTKVQMGVQSIDQRVLDMNERRIDVERMEEAFALCRLFGFKIHAHFMVNLLGSTPAADKADYLRFVGPGPFQPDEVKLYPCALIEGTRLVGRHKSGEWEPYTEEELLDVLASDIVATPAFCRVSRMIRDFSSNDIVAGNKKPNLRQMVERRLSETGQVRVREIRYREIGSDAPDPAELEMDVVAYSTPTSEERFLQWVTPEGKIAGFLRLSLPDQRFVSECMKRYGDDAPVGPREAMIREVHVYGVAARVGQEGVAAQHRGLGRALVARACELSREAGFERINVISAVGTREYYRSLGFLDHGLYQQKAL